MDLPSEQFTCISYSSVSNRHHVVCYIPCSYLFYKQKFIPFDHLPTIPLPHPPPLITTSLICFAMSLFFFFGGGGSLFRFRILVIACSIYLFLSDLVHLA